MFIDNNNCPIAIDSWLDVHMDIMKLKPAKANISFLSSRQFDKPKYTAPVKFIWNVNIVLMGCE